MNVLLTSAYPDEKPVRAMREAAALDRFGVHHTTDEPETADLILFVEASHYEDDIHFTRLRAHPWVARFREKTFMYNEQDIPWCVLPGLYCSMPKRFFSRARQRACCYVAQINPLIEEAARSTAEPDILYSFLGARNHPVRARLLDAEHPEGCVQDPSFRTYDLDPREARTGFERYVNVLARSRFVLCPRGAGTSSFRLFEALQAGRVPVILSDDWIAPDGPDWAKTSLRLPEADAGSVSGFVRSHADRWPEMSRAARRSWEEWYAPDVKFHRMVEDLCAIRRDRRVPESLSQRLPQPLYLYYRLHAALVPRLRKTLGR